MAYTITCIGLYYKEGEKVEDKKNKNDKDKKELKYEITKEKIILAKDENKEEKIYI